VFGSGRFNAEEPSHQVEVNSSWSGPMPGVRTTSASGMRDATYSAVSTSSAYRSFATSKAGAWTDGSTPRTSVSCQIWVNSRATSGVVVCRLIMPAIKTSSGCASKPSVHSASVSAQAAPNSLVPHSSSKRSSCSK
jgi:hypothetical protein